MHRSIWAFSITTILASCSSNVQKASLPDQFPDSAAQRIDLASKCVKPEMDLLKPHISKLNQVSAAKAMAPNNPLALDHAVVELEISNFDKNVPPRIRVSNNETGVLIDDIEFRALDYPCEAPTTLKVPIFLAYDDAPWNSPNGEPKIVTTRIQLRLSELDHAETVYAKLQSQPYGGVYVVPVVWHNVGETGKAGVVYTDNETVNHLFWSPPSGNFDDVNSIWAQAGVQFRLTSTTVPFQLSAIPNHVVPSGESQASDCLVGWKTDLNSKEGVDVFAVYRLKSGESSNPAGTGNCYGQGYVLIRASATDNWSRAALAEVVSHEFGHYLASLPHNDTVYNNLMGSGVGGWELTQAQQLLVRERLRNLSSYNETR